LPAGTTVTNFYKQNVYDPADNKIGDVDDMLIDKEGRVTALIIGVGRFWERRCRSLQLRAGEREKQQMVSGPEHEQGCFEGGPRIHPRQDQNDLDACRYIDNDEARRGAAKAGDSGPALPMAIGRGAAICGDLTTPLVLPAWIKPQLTELMQEPPDGTAWLHEIKLLAYTIPTAG
jgi:sporulation protein YlmC with PRC-barrel domain